MTAYINITFNHFAALQKWVTESGGAATLDVKDFTVEVKHRGRYYRMYPLFQANVDGQQVHLPKLTPQVRGFGGWRPYQTITHTHSSDKQLFKQFLAEAGLCTPQSWGDPGQPPAGDHVLKARKGSFGRGLFGPFRAGTAPLVGEAEARQYGPLFAEQFVHGRALKVWFWGARAFFAHMQACPVIAGDGASTAQALLQRKLRSAVTATPAGLHDFAAGCLAFQGIGLEEVLAAGREAWIDYRYGQQYTASWGTTAVSDNQLQALRELSGAQLEDMGSALARLLRQTLPLPVMITCDGVLDAEGRIWWLEMNTNSLLPPEAYAAMFADLFG